MMTMAILVVGIAILAILVVAWWVNDKIARAAASSLLLLADGRERSSIALREEVGAEVYVALADLEEHGLVARRIDDDDLVATAMRGGRPRSYYRITDAGCACLRRAMR